MKEISPAFLGGALLLRGLGRHSLRGCAMALVGGWLLLRTLDGTDRIKRGLRGRKQADSRRDERSGTPDGIDVCRSILVGRSADELYDAWRDPDQLSKIVGHVGDVTSPDDDRLRWTVRGPLGRDVSWESRIVEEEPGEFIRWETAGDAAVPNEGSVSFRPTVGDRGTKVTLTVSLHPPGGAVGNAALNRLVIAPETVAGTALRRFKSLLETGEIPTLERNPSARGSGDLL